MLHACHLEGSASAANGLTLLLLLLLVGNAAGCCCCCQCAVQVRCLVPLLGLLLPQSAPVAEAGRILLLSMTWLKQSPLSQQKG